MKPRAGRGREEAERQRRIIMFRKLMLTGAVSLALLSPLALPSNAAAHDFHHEHRHEHLASYRVYYRDPCRPVWVYGGCFEGRHVALRFAEQFRCRGFEIS